MGSARPGLIACGAAGLASLGSAAAAQGSEYRKEIGVSARVLYDSNIARASEEIAQLRGLVQEDVRFSPAVTVDLARTAGPHLLYVDALAGWDFHARNTQLDRERLQGRAGILSRFGWCRTTLETTAVRRQSELQEILLDDVTNTETTASVLGRVSCPRPAGFYPSAEVQYATTDNSSDTRRDADSRTVSGEAAINFGQPTFGQAALFVRYSETDYPNRPVSLGPNGAMADRFAVRQVGIAYTREVGALLRGSVSVAYTSVDRAAEGQEFDGVTYAARLQFRPEQRLNGRLAIERNVQSANRIGVSYSVDTLKLAEVNYRLTPRVLFGAGGSIRDKRLELAPGALLVTATDEETRTLFASMRIDLNERVRFAVDARREKRDSNLNQFDYVSSRIEVAANVSF